MTNTRAHDFRGLPAGSRELLSARLSTISGVNRIRPWPLGAPNERGQFAKAGAYQLTKIPDPGGMVVVNCAGVRGRVLSADKKSVERHWSVLPKGHGAIRFNIAAEQS